MKAATPAQIATNKIEELRKLIDNKKCFDCHEKVIVKLNKYILGNYLCSHGFRYIRMFILLRYSQRNFTQSQRTGYVQFFRERDRDYN
jgi:hypothetical protein